MKLKDVPDDGTLNNKLVRIRRKGGFAVKEGVLEVFTKNPEIKGAMIIAANLWQVKLDNEQDMFYYSGEDEILVVDDE